MKLYTLLSIQVLPSLYKRGKLSGPLAELSIPGTLATIVDEEELAPDSSTVATTVQGVMPAGITDWPPGEGYHNTNRPKQRYHSSPYAKGPTVERPQDALSPYDLHSNVCSPPIT